MRRRSFSWWLTPNSSETLRWLYSVLFVKNKVGSVKYWWTLPPLQQLWYCQRGFIHCVGCKSLHRVLVQFSILTAHGDSQVRGINIFSLWSWAAEAGFDSWVSDRSRDFLTPALHSVVAEQERRERTSELLCLSVCDCRDPQHRDADPHRFKTKVVSWELCGPPREKMLRRRPSNASEKEQTQKKKVRFFYLFISALKEKSSQNDRVVLSICCETLQPLSRLFICCSQSSWIRRKNTSVKVFTSKTDDFLMVSNCSAAACSVPLLWWFRCSLSQKQKAAAAATSEHQPPPTLDTTLSIHISAPALRLLPCKHLRHSEPSRAAVRTGEPRRLKLWCQRSRWFFIRWLDVCSDRLPASCSKFFFSSLPVALTKIESELRLD